MPGKKKVEPIEPKPRKKPKGLTPFEAIYPPLEGFALISNKTGGRLHCGYGTDRAKPCFCGAMPVFEQYVQDTGDDGRNTPAKTFVAICPVCELRGEGEGTLEYVLEKWNNREFSEDSLMVHGPLLEYSYEAAKNFFTMATALDVEEAKTLIKRKHDIKATIPDVAGSVREEMLQMELKRINGDLRQLEIFLQDVETAIELDARFIVSKLREFFYPDLTQEERNEITLHLNTL